MPRYLPVLRAEENAELDRAWRAHRSVGARQRLLVLRLIGQGRLNAQQIAQVAGVARSTVFRYLASFQRGGVTALLQRRHRGGKAPTLAGPDHAAFVEEMRHGRFLRARDAQSWIEARTRRRLALSSVYTLLAGVRDHLPPRDETDADEGGTHCRAGKSGPHRPRALSARHRS